MPCFLFDNQSKPFSQRRQSNQNAKACSFTDRLGSQVAWADREINQTTGRREITLIICAIRQIVSLCFQFINKGDVSQGLEESVNLSNSIFQLDQSLMIIYC